MAKFLDKMGQKLSQAANTAKEKSKELLDGAKVSKRLAEVENEIYQLKLKIGEQFYQAYSTATEPEQLVETCLEIDTLRQELIKLRQELDQIKGTTHCPNCGEALEQVAAFCPYCGGKLLKTED